MVKLIRVGDLLITCCFVEGSVEDSQGILNILIGNGLVKYGFALGNAIFNFL
jgi:hypothetical protein